MSLPRILVCGGVSDIPSLQEALSPTGSPDYLHPQVTVEPGYPPLVSPAEVGRYDIVLMFVDTSATPTATFQYLRHLVADYPFLPVVVVGEPAQKKQGMLLLKAAQYLPAGAEVGAIARATLRAYQAAWWNGIRHLDKPTLIVDRQGVILRANAVANERYGLNIVGQTYCRRVERIDSDEIPDMHPIRQALDSKVGAVCRYHGLVDSDGHPRRWNLICIPILGLRDEIPAVGVVVDEMDQWEHIFRSSAQFARERDMDRLLCRIVSEAKALGYERIRLMRYDPTLRRLKGLESAGFEIRRDEAFRKIHGMGREQYFKEVFEIDLVDDEPSRDTEKSRFPAICVHRPPGTTAASARNLIEREYDHRNYEFLLDKDKVGRWIDVPLMVSAESGKELTFWGKMSVDNGPLSDCLNARDVACLTLFAMNAAAAIGTMERVVQERAQTSHFLEFSQKLAQRPDPTASKPTTARVLNLLRDLYQQLTGAEEIHYLEWKQRDEMSRRKDVLSWSSKKTESGEEVVGVSTRIPMIRSLTDRIDHQGKWKGLVAPLLPQQDGTVEVDDASPTWRSASAIPIVVHGHFRGAFIAFSDNPDAFSGANATSLFRLIDTAALWYELGELQEGQRWRDANMGQILPNLPVLSQVAADDEKFAACLVAMLSAGSALCWNRVMYFSAIAPGLGGRGARLVHAVGGCGEDSGETKHELKQEQATRDYPDLAALLAIRRQDSVPKDRHGETDSLYQVCVEASNAEAPIEIPFTPADEMDPFRSKPCGFGEDPLRWMLEKDSPDVPCVPISLHRETTTQWFKIMDRDHPGMFPPKLDMVYAFPLWATYNRQRRPLGLVIVDMLYQPQARVEDMINATRLILDLAATSLAAGCQDRLNQGMIRVSSMLEHNNRLKEDWDTFFRQADRFLEHVLTSPSNGSEPRAVSRALEVLTGTLGLTSQGLDVPGKISHTASDMREKMKQFNEAFQKQIKTQEVLTAQLRHRPNTSIPDLVKHLDTIIDSYTRAAGRAELRWKRRPISVLTVPCDPLVFDDIVKNLVDNARTAAGRDRLEVEVEVEVEVKPGTAGFDRFIEIRFTNNGPRITDEQARFLFLDGYSYPAGNSNLVDRTPNRGRGLPTSRSGLRTFHGDLQFRQVDGKDEGATFCILFGIPVAESHRGANETSSTPATLGVSL